MTAMDKERRDYLRGFATSRNVVSMSPETVVELLDALEAATERAERAERERDDARTMMGAVGELLDEANAKIRDDFYRDAWRCLVARVDRDGGQRQSEDEDEAVTTERIDREIARLLGVERERDEARAERDARPEITPEDAAAKWDDSDAGQRIQFALRAHARKAVTP